MLAPALAQELLQCYPIIHELPPRLQEALQLQGQPVHALPGQEIFSVNDPCNSYLMVVEGTLRVGKTSPNGREMTLYRVLPGDSCILTVSCLLGDARYPASGVVEKELSAVGISQALFEQLIAESPAFRRSVFGFFAERLTVLMALIEAVAFQRLDERLAGLLWREGPCLQKTHQMLADELGSVREVISRILKEFETQGLVRLDRGQILVLEPDRLARIASVDFA
jgi:CRP/FNR family transcriptional regulator